MVAHRTAIHRAIRVLSLLAFCGSVAPLFGQAIDKPVASVRLTRLQVITSAQLQKQLAQLAAQAQRDLTKDEQRQYLDQVVNRALVEQAAARDQVTISDADVQARIDDYRKTIGSTMNLGRDMTDAEMQSYAAGIGLSWSDFLGQIRYEVLRIGYVRAKRGSELDAVPTPTDAEVEDYYNYHKKDYVSDDMVRIRHIFVDTRGASTQSERDALRKKASDILVSLRGGASFDVLQASFSDDVAARARGGELGIFDRLDPERQRLFGKPFIDAIFRLQKGETSGVLGSNLGFHIVQLIDRFDAVLLGLDDKIPPGYTSTVRSFIRQNLLVLRQSDAMAKAFNDVVAELKKQADIHIYEENLQ